MASRRNRRQALAEAELRYGPERDAIAAILSSLKGDYRSQSMQVRRASRMLESSARAGIPAVRDAYGRAEAAATAQRAASNAALAKLGPGAGAYKSAAAYDLAARVPLGSSEAGAVQELASRASEAPVRRVEELRALRGQYRSDQAKALDQLSSNVRSSGLYASTRYGELQGEAAKTRNDNRQKARDRAQRDRASKRSAGIDPATGRPIPGGKLDPKRTPKKWASQEQQLAAGKAITRASKAAKALLKANPTIKRSEMAAALRAGAKPQPVYRVVNGKQVRVLNPDGTQKMTPALPSIDNDLFLAVGLDVAYRGFVSRKNVKLLHANQIRIKPLGLRTAIRVSQGHVEQFQTPGPNGEMRPG